MKLYVLVRNDLSKSQQAVQGGHAVAEYMKEVWYGEEEWNNGTLIYLRGGDLDQLKASYDFLHGKEPVEIAAFHEPDLDNEMTAFAVLGTRRVDHLMGRFKLL